MGSGQAQGEPYRDSCWGRGFSSLCGPQVLIFVCWGISILTKLWDALTLQILREKLQENDKNVMKHEGNHRTATMTIWDSCSIAAKLVRWPTNSEKKTMAKVGMVCIVWISRVWCQTLNYLTKCATLCHYRNGARRNSTLFLRFVVSRLPVSHLTSHLHARTTTSKDSEL